MEFKIKNKEIRKLMKIKEPEFPKYATQIINLANQMCVNIIYNLMIK